MNYQLLTILVVLGTIAAISIYDVWVFKKTHKNTAGDATISHILLTVAMKRPIVAVMFGLVIGLLMGHLWWPQHIYHCQ